MNKMPTAEELKEQMCKEFGIKYPSLMYPNTFTTEFGRRYAAFHVEAALKAASEKARTIDEPINNGSDEGGYATGVHKQSILNAYPKELIQ